MSKWNIGIITACLTLLGTSLAWSQSPSEENVPVAERLYAEGASYFNQGRYNEALEKFRQAHALVPEPNLLFNIGRCYEATGQLEKAVEAYAECARSQNVTDATRQRAEARATALRDVIDKTRTQSTAPDGAATRAETGQTAPGVGSAVTTAPQVTTSPYSPWTWIALATGITLATAGAIFATLGQKDHDDIISLDGYDNQNATLNMTRKEALDLSDSGDLKKTIGFSLMGVGAAALVTSTVLFILQASSGNRESPDSQTDVAMTGSVLPGGGGAVMLRGCF